MEEQELLAKLYDKRWELEEALKNVNGSIAGLERSILPFQKGDKVVIHGFIETIDSNSILFPICVNISGFSFWTDVSALSHDKED